MRCDPYASLLTRNLASPCLNREPKARVAIIFNIRKFNLKLEAWWHTRILSFSNAPSSLTDPFLLMDMSILTKG